jgi:hypothetical protein
MSETIETMSDRRNASIFHKHSNREKLEIVCRSDYDSTKFAYEEYLRTAIKASVQRE